MLGRVGEMSVVVGGAGCVTGGANHGKYFHTRFSFIASYMLHVTCYVFHIISYM